MLLRPSNAIANGSRYERKQHSTPTMMVVVAEHPLARYGICVCVKDGVLPDRPAAYVIMIAGANEISAGSVGLVYLAAIVPCLFLKLSVPYW